MDKRLVLFAIITFSCSQLACSKKDAGVGTTSEALDAASPNVIVGSAHTPSVVASRSLLAMAFTSTSGAASPTRWATFNGASWNVCDVTNIPSGCNGGSTPPPTGLTHWLGKGAVAADGKGNVVYVTLANNTSSTTVANWVVTMVSTNDGVTYTNAAQLVNESGGDCDPATEDLPDVTVDMTTTPPTFWFAWRHNGAGSFGACVRRGTISIGADGGVTGGITWLDKVRSVGGMDREGIGGVSEGQGGLRIVAGDGAVSIGYSNTDQLKTCTDTSLISMAWGSVSSFDNGASWSNTSVAYHTENFLSCPYGSIQNGIRAFDMIRAQDGTYYLAVADWNATATTATLHLFMNEGTGIQILGFPSNSHVWREFCPGFQDTPDGGPMTGAPAGNWTRPGTLCTTSPPPFPTSKAILFPTLASDGQSRISLLWYEGADSAHIHPAYMGNIAPRTSSSSFLTVDPLGANSASPGRNVFLNHSAMTAWSAQTPDSCGAAGLFFPIFVQADGTGQTLKYSRVAIP